MFHRNDLSMESCEALTNGIALPNSPSLSPSTSVTLTASDSIVLHVGSRARSRSHSMVDAAALTSVGQDGPDSETSTAALQSVLHHITTRSATGRLAKRPKRDPSPPLSPPRKLGMAFVIYYGISVTTFVNCIPQFLFKCCLFLDSRKTLSN